MYTTSFTSLLRLSCFGLLVAACVPAAAQDAATPERDTEVRTAAARPVYTVYSRSCSRSPWRGVDFTDLGDACRSAGIRRATRRNVYLVTGGRFDEWQFNPVEAAAVRCSVISKSCKSFEIQRAKLTAKQAATVAEQLRSRELDVVILYDLGGVPGRRNTEGPQG